MFDDLRVVLGDRTFAIEICTPHTRLTKQSRKQFNAEFSDVWRIFGLGHARRVVFGNAAIRGISGGQKKHCFIAEAYVSLLFGHGMPRSDIM